MSGGRSKAKTAMAVNKALEWFQKNPALSFREVDEALGYHTSACSKWYKANTCNFKNRYDELLQMEFAALEAPAIKCIGDLIKEDRSFQAAKYVLDNRGYKAADKIEAEVKNDINIVVGE